MSASTTLTFRVDNKLASALKLLSAITGETSSDILRDALQKCIATKLEGLDLDGAERVMNERHAQERADLEATKAAVASLKR